MTIEPQEKVGISGKSAFGNEFHRLIATLKNVLVVTGIVLAGTHLLLAQHSGDRAHKGREQSRFGAELIPIQRPVILSRAALKTLSKDERVDSCLASESLPPEQLPAHWFIASEIHLAGPSEIDLIVQPRGPLPNMPPEDFSKNLCLVGANTAQFWVLRKTPKGFVLVLSQMAHDVEVLRTRTNSLRDIQVAATVGSGHYALIDYRFNGHSYEIAGRSFEQIGADVPRDLSGYETSEPFVQLRGEPSGPIRAKARAWIWQHWKEQRLSYLKVQTTNRDMSEETCTYFIHRSESGDWQITLKVRRVSMAAGSSAKSQRKLIETELLVADRVQRIEPGDDDDSSTDGFPDSKELPALEYKLRFLDYAKRTVRTL